MRMAPERGSPSAPVRWFWRLTYVLASIACGLASRAVSAQCRIVVEQAHLKGVMVSAPGVSFALDIDGVPLTIEPETGKANASVQVMAPLRFAASYPMDKLAFRIKELVDLYGGRIRLGKKAASAWLGIRGDDMQLSLHSTLGIDVKQPLQIPCSHVGLSDGTPYSTPDVVWPSKDRTIGTGTTFFPLYLGPQEVEPLHVQYRGPFRILRKQPGWVLLEAAWADGSKVTGWTLERNTTSQVAPVGGWGEGLSGGGRGGCSDQPRVAKFTLREHAPIAASPGGPVWAWVARTLAVDALPLDRSDGWIQVISFPGLLSDPCSEYEHIWVHARDVLWTGAAAEH